MVIALGKAFGSRNWVLMTGSLPSLTHTSDSSSPEQYFTFSHEDTYPLLCRPLTQPTLCSWGLAFLHLAKLPVIGKLGDFTLYSLRPEGFRRLFCCILKLGVDLCQKIWGACLLSERTLGVLGLLPPLQETTPSSFWLPLCLVSREALHACWSFFPNRLQTGSESSVSPLLFLSRDLPTEYL